MPGGAPVGGNVRYQHHRLRVIRVHVEDGRVHHAAHVSAVGRGAGVARVCRETDLIVRHNVDGALGWMGKITIKKKHTKTFFLNLCPRSLGAEIKLLHGAEPKTKLRIALQLLSFYHRLEDIF